MSAEPDKLEAALSYVERGWAVLPLWWVVDGGCACGDAKCSSPGKHPLGSLVPHGVKGASADPDVVRGWWRAQPDANVGIATGAASGFDVLDVDGDVGEEAVRELEREYGELPATVESLTGGGGRHVLFSVGPEVRNAVRFAPGLDVRTTGGYVVAPPSRHASGRSYCWEVTCDPEDVAIAAWPTWLIALTRAGADRATGTASNGGVAKGGPLLEGGRNAHLTSLAGTMRRRGMTENEIATALLKVNMERCRPPLDDTEVTKVAGSVSRYAPEQTADELLDAAGFDDLVDPLSAGDLEALITNLREKAEGISAIRHTSLREAAIRRLKEAGVSSPARAVDVALGPPPSDEDTEREKQGKALSFEETEPWPSPVDGAELLEELVDLIKRYVILPADGADAAALWILHTYSWEEAADYSPRLGITGPTKRCGKSRLLEVLTGLVRRPLSTANVSPAALFRAIEKFTPTLLIDEGDTFLRESEDLRGLLNAGQRRGGGVLRAVGEDHEPRRFGVFGPVAVALIGALPDTVRDRAILVPMRRRTKSEVVARLRFADFERECDPLRRRAARWVADHLAQLRSARPGLPEALDDRAADGWEPLLAIADSVGGAWPTRAREVAIGISASRETQEEGMGVRLLRDVRAIFDAGDMDRLPSAKLIEALVRLEDRPWSDWRHGKPITARKVADLLRPFSVVSRSIRLPNGKTPKGYRLCDFDDAFIRYLSRDTRHDATEAVSSTESAAASRNTMPPVAADNARGMASNGACGGVADREAQSPTAGVPESPGPAFHLEGS